MTMKTKGVCGGRGIARKALACMTSMVLAVGLMPGVALADKPDPQYVEDTSETIEGNIDVTGGNAFYALNATGEKGDVDVEVTGSVNIESGNYESKAVDVNVWPGRSAEVVIGSGNGGNATITSNYNGSDPGWVVGVHAQVGHEGSDRIGTADVTVNGDVGAVGDEDFGENVPLYGVRVDNVNGQANVTVNDVSVERKSQSEGGSANEGVSINDSSCGPVIVKSRDVSVKGAGNSTGVSISKGIGDGTSMSTAMVSNVTVEGVTFARGLFADNHGNSGAVIAAIGDVVARASDLVDGRAIGVQVACGMGDEGASEQGGVTILVDGTVTAIGGKSYGIVLSEGSKNLDATAWKVAVGTGGLVAAKAADAAFVVDKPIEEAYERDEALEAAIDYIIRINPEQGGILGLVAGTFKSKAINVADETLNYQVANMGQKVYLQAAEGWVITGGTSDEGKTVALKHDDNGWYVEVPNGGGVFLTAQLAKQQFDVTFKNEEKVLQSSKLDYGDMPEYKGETPTKDQTVESVYEFAGWKPVIDKVTGDVVYEATFTEKPREYEISFDLDGGTVDGKSTCAYTAAYGSTITLPTPVRENYEFQYWEGSRYEAGASYKVEGAHSFKAVWKQKDPAPEPTPEPTPTPEPAPVKASPAADSTTLPATSDTAPVLPVVATLLVSATALVVSRKKLQAAR